MSAQEIREALEAHARFDDTAALARLGSVKARVRVVRRRRRAALAGAAAAVIAVAGGVATHLPGRHEAAPASRTFGDLTAPATMTSEGATYRFKELVTGEDEVRWADDVDGPVLVSWAATGDGPVHILKTVDSDFTYSSVEDFRDFLPVDHVDDQTIQAVGKGRVALAVYTFAEPAAGARADIDGTPVVFRDRMPGYLAVASGWGAAGPTDLRMCFAYPEGQLEMTSFCMAPKGYELHVDVAGPGMGIGCHDAPSVHGPGSRHGFSEGLTRPDGSNVVAGARVTMHAWLSRQGSDQPVRGPIEGVRIGAAAYETEPGVAVLNGWSLTELREEAGHAWRFVKVLPEVPAGDATALQVDGHGRPKLVLVSVSPGAGRVQLRVDGSTVVGFSGGVGGGFLTPAGPFGAGQHTVGVRSQHPATMEAALYEQVD